MTAPTVPFVVVASIAQVHAATLASVERIVVTVRPELSRGLAVDQVANDEAHRREITRTGGG
jgi:hypothetical protein